MIDNRVYIELAKCDGCGYRKPCRLDMKQRKFICRACDTKTEKEKTQ